MTPLSIYLKCALLELAIFIFSANLDFSLVTAELKELQLFCSRRSKQYVEFISFNTSFDFFEIFLFILSVCLESSVRGGAKFENQEI